MFRSPDDATSILPIAYKGVTTYKIRSIAGCVRVEKYAVLSVSFIIQKIAAKEHSEVTSTLMCFTTFRCRSQTKAVFYAKSQND